MKSVLFVFLFLSVSISAFSQDLPMKIYDGKEYYLLPDTFDVGKAMFPFVHAPGYFSQFNLRDGDWIKMTAYKGFESYPSLTGKIVNSKPEGKWTSYSINWDDTTSIISSTKIFRDGVLDGAYKYYFNDGSLQAEYMMKDNNYHGSVFHYSSEGKITVMGNYNYGIQTGKWFYNDRSGSPSSIESYVESISEDMQPVYSDPLSFKEAFYYDKPEIKESHLKPGADGIWKMYFKDELQLEKVYDNGLLVYVKEYYPNGILKAEGPCKGEYPPQPQKRSYDPKDRKDDYIRTGTWIYRDESGNVITVVE